MTFHWKYTRDKADTKSLRGHPYMVYVEVEWEEEVLRGIACCHINDNFDRRIGRRIALTRAVKKLPRAIRSLIWAEYWRLNPNLVPQ